MPNFNTGIGNLPKLISGDSISGGDAIDLIGRLLGHNWDIMAPLQEFAGDALKGIASGDDSMLQRMMGPAISGVKAQLPHIQREVTDKMGTGGLALEAQGRAITNQQGDIAKIMGEGQRGLTNTSLNTGMNVFPQTVSPLMGITAARAQAKAASNGGGKK